MSIRGMKIDPSPKLLKSKKDITYTNGFLHKRKVILQRRQIININYAGSQVFTKHPLEPNGFDYIGIGIAEKEVQFLVQEGNLEITLNYGRYRFGRNVYFDDADEIIKRINNFA